jgi:NADPH-dependent curcumin reductase CurA
MGLAWHLASRPKGLPTAANFELKEHALAPLGAGMIRVRNRWLSVDPHTRFRMDDNVDHLWRTHHRAYAVGEPLEGFAIGAVIESRADGFAPGDTVFHYLGWREESVLLATAARRIVADGVPEQAFLGLLGITGATAYFGLRKAQPRAGEILFVSAAGGAVGSTVVQIAKIKGMIVIGSTGGAKKCAFVRELGADAVIDYKAGPVLEQLHKVAPDGIDVYFDNVGGDHLDAALALARERARFSMCGTIGNYNNGAPAELHHLLDVVSQRIRIEGFVATDYLDEFPAFIQEMTGWMKAGRITLRETIREGLEATPAAFLDLFSGASLGKMLVRL